MHKILDDLWYGNICSFEKSTEYIEQINDLTTLVKRNREILSDTLTDKQQETLEKYDDCIKEMLDIMQKEIFICGFRLGGRFMLATVTDSE